MTTPTLRLNPPASSGDNILKQRLQKNFKDVNFFKNSCNSFKERITYFNDKNHKSKEKYKKTPTSLFESIDTVVFLGATTTSVILSITVVCLIVVPITAVVALALSLGNKVLHKTIIYKQNKNKKQTEKIKSLLNLLKNFIGKTYKIL